MWTTATIMSSSKCFTKTASTNAALTISPNRTGGATPGAYNGYDGASPVANSILLHHHIPYHLPILHDRISRLAHCPRNVASCDRSTGLSRDLRVLAEDIRRGVWSG